MSSCQKLENTSSIVFELEFKQEKNSHQNQELAGSRKYQLFNPVSIRLLIGKNSHQNQDILPASGRNNCSVLFEIKFALTYGKKITMEKMSSCQKLENTSSIVFELEFYQEKSSDQNQELAGSRTYQFFNTFSIRLLIGKNQPPEPRSCRNLEETLVQYSLK